MLIATEFWNKIKIILNLEKLSFILGPIVKLN